MTRRWRGARIVSVATSVIQIETPHGPGRAHVTKVRGARGAVVLGHGAGGGVTSRDLGAASQAAVSERFSLVLVEQPYRVAGRRSPAPAAQLDGAWTAVLEQLRAGPLSGRPSGRRAAPPAGLPLIAGGRSSGARVACRTAQATRVVACLCLAFPLHPPGRGEDPSKSRLGELEAAGVPTLVVQGERDPFGVPPAGDGWTVVTVPGDHSLRCAGAVRRAVAAWLPGLEALAAAEDRPPGP